MEYVNLGFASSGSSTTHRCVALDKSRKRCQQRLSDPQGTTWCAFHAEERRRMRDAYKETEHRYRYVGRRSEELSPDTLRMMIVLAKATVNLRTEVNDRFFSDRDSDSNRGHVRWILKLIEEIGELEERLEAIDHPLSPQVQQSSHTEDQNQFTNEQATSSTKNVSGSMLSPQTPWSASSHLKDGHQAKVLKQFLSEVSDPLLKRLYQLAPSLDDSSEGTTKWKANRGGNDTGKLQPDYDIVRFIFRQLVLWRADPDVLRTAQQTSSIDSFLRSFPSEIKKYIEFFESEFGRSDTLHFLRDAVCDYLLGGVSSTTMILGGHVMIEDSERKMEIEGWDLLHTYFGDIVNWANIGCFCFNSQDLSLITKLIAMGRYGQKEHVEWCWLHRERSIAQENVSCVLHGFVGLTKGYIEPLPVSPPEFVDGKFTEKTSRCYLTGIMSKNEPMARNLIKELVRRVAKFIVLVYDGQPYGKDHGDIVDRNDDDKIPWIARTRTATGLESLKDSSWEVEFSLDHIMTDLLWIRQLAYRDMATDYFHFIIIERQPNRKFTISSEVGDILMYLDGDPPLQDLAHKAIKTFIPEEQRQKYIDAVEIVDEDAEVLSNIDTVQYEGSRVRTWYMTEDLKSILRKQRSLPQSQSQLRFVNKIVGNLEARGLISPLTRFQQPLTTVIAVQSMDGLQDLYFDYNFEANARIGSVQDTLMASEKGDPALRLYDFACRYKERHQYAVFAKGSIKVHYCAWPMPAIRPCTFRTVDGLLYEWKVMPFDMPLSQHAWQYYLDHKLESIAEFACFAQTTCVVCAPSAEEARKSYKLVHTAATAEGWTISLPHPSQWTADIESLDLKTLWTGVRPACQTS